MRKLLYSIMLAAILGSCKNQDEGSPAVNGISANGIEGDLLHGLAGSVNTFHITVSDDQRLKQVKCELISPSGFHTHEATAGENITAFRAPNYGRWDTLVVNNIDGLSASADFSLYAPDTITGGWNVEVGVLDENGNLTTKRYIFHIQNDSLPGFYIGETTPATSSDGIIRMSIGETLTLSGSIFDTDSLQYVSAILKKGSAEVWTMDVDPVNSWNFNLGGISISEFSAAANYTLTLYAGDTGGWETYRQATIVVQ